MIYGSQSESPDCGIFLQIQDLISSKLTDFRPENLSWRISEIWQRGINFSKSVCYLSLLIPSRNQNSVVVQLRPL